jgi:hypothetical protein
MTCRSDRLNPHALKAGGLTQQHSVSLLVSFRAWLDEQAPQVLPQSLLGKAIAYTRNQWEYPTSR